MPAHFLHQPCQDKEISGREDGCNPKRCSHLEDLKFPQNKEDNNKHEYRPGYPVDIPKHALLICQLKPQFLAQYLVHRLRVGFTLARLHDLPDEKTEQFGVLFGGGGLALIGGDGVIDHSLNRAHICDLL